MRAETEQIPVKNLDKRSDTLSKPVNTGPIWARVRKIEARLDTLEMRASTSRRDIDRVEKRYSREDIKNQPSSNEFFDQVAKELEGL